MRNFYDWFYRLIRHNKTMVIGRLHQLSGTLCGGVEQERQVPSAPFPESSDSFDILIIITEVKI